MLPKRQRLSPAQLLAVPRAKGAAEPCAAEPSTEAHVAAEARPWCGRTRSTMSLLAPYKTNKKTTNAGDRSSPTGSGSLRRSFSERWRKLTPANQRLVAALAKGACGNQGINRKDKCKPAPASPPLPPPEQPPEDLSAAASLRISANTRSKSKKPNT